MKMIVLISCIMFFACKNDTPQKSANTQDDKITKAVELKDSNSEKPSSILEGSDALTKNEIEVREKVVDDKSKIVEDENSKVKPKISPKSEPKPVVKDKKEILEKVDLEKLNDTKVDGGKSVPKPEDKERKEIVEQVEIKDKVDRNKKDIPREKGAKHSKFNELLSKYVSTSGAVNYEGLRSEIAKLDSYIQELSSTSVSLLNRKEKLAFWINAYNANTLKLIVDNYPISKITDLEGGKPWDKKWITINGKLLSLNNIENDIIRPQFKEPRIHFAVNCAAKSCPPLLNKAWTASNLETNFEKQTKKFINNPQFNRIENGNIEISKIFEWYASDFGDLISFINKYSSTSISADASVTYKDYNWKLNN